MTIPVILFLIKIGLAEMLLPGHGLELGTFNPGIPLDKLGGVADGSASPSPGVNTGLRSRLPAAPTSSRTAADLAKTAEDNRRIRQQQTKPTGNSSPLSGTQTGNTTQ